MKGTWQGSGTWQTSGPDFTGLIGAGVLIGIAAAVAMVVLEFILWIAAFVAAALVGLVIAAVVYRRKSRAREAMLEATRAERHARIFAAEAKAVEEKQPPAIEHHYHGPSIHIHGGSHEEAASLIRRALTERKD